MSESAPMIRPPDASFAEGAWPQAQSENLEGPVGDLFSSTKQVMRGAATGIAEYGQTDPESGRQLSEPEEKVAPDVLNKQYGIPGKLTFSDAIPDSVARSMYETHIDAVKQQDIANRAPPGFVNGAVRLGAQFAVGFLDPLQLGAAMVPVVPEIELGTSLAARVGGKALAQGAGGLVATAPLVGLQYGLSRQEQSDFTAYDAMFELAQGAGFGAGIGALEAGGSALGAELSRRYKASRGRQVSDADPAVRTGSAQTAISQLEQENPVEVRPVYDQSDTPNVPEEAGYGATQPIGQARSTAFLPENEPKGLTSFLQQDFTVGRPGDVNSERRAGGLTGPGGDLDAIIGGPRGRPGLINNESGSSLSEAANRAHEAGYFDHVPDDNELLDAIAKDHNRTNANDAIYSNRDQDAADDYRYARQRNVEIDQVAAQTGIPTAGLTHEQFWDQVADHLSQEDALQHVDRLQAEHEASFEQAEQAAKDWVSYHGTPHEFDQFDTAQIGTGEGAQAYGHGLYFAENEGVADSYRRQLTAGSDADRDTAKAWLKDAGGDPEKAIEMFRAHAAEAGLRPSEIADTERIIRNPEGHLLTVRLNAKPEEMLDWDKPLAEQPEHVKDAFRRAGFNENEITFGKITGGEAYKALAERLAPTHEEAPSGWGSVAGGPVSYDGQVHSPSAASRALHDAGVKGIRYLDRSSRAEGEGTRNVVVFDHNDVEITHRNGEPVERKPFDPEEVYRGAPHTLEDMEHEWKQAEAANPVLPGEGGGGQSGPAAEPAGDVQTGDGQVSGSPGAAGRAGPEERSQILQSALRDASGQRPPDPTSLAAERALKEGTEKNLLKLAQQDIEDHTAFFQAAEDAGHLTDEVRAELEAINGLDEEATNLTKAAKQAAACIARGMV